MLLVYGNGVQLLHFVGIVTEIVLQDYTLLHQLKRLQFCFLRLDKPLGITILPVFGVIDLHITDIYFCEHLFDGIISGISNPYV